MVPEAGFAEEAQRTAGLKKVPLDGFMGEALDQNTIRSDKLEALAKRS